MALAATALPYGLREVDVTPIDAAGDLGTAVKLPNAQTFSFEEGEEFQELRGDDRLVAIRGSGPAVNFSLEAGGISLAAYKVLTGGTIAETGTTPEEVKTLTKLASDSRPYFRVRGRAISDSGGDVHCELPRCRVSGSLQGEFADGEFFITSCEGQAIADPDAATGEDIVYKFTHNETAAALA